MKLLWFIIVELILQMCEGNESQEGTSFFEIPLYPSCIEPGTEISCSGHGICIEGSCLCDSLDDVDPLYRYSGKYCEECPYCKGQRCQKIFQCLKECQTYGTCYNTSCGLPFVVDNYNGADRGLHEKHCLVEDENGCFVTFKYGYENDEALLVFKSNRKECFNGSALILYVFIGVVMYILSLFALIHCLCDRCPRSRYSSNRRRNVDIIRIPTSLDTD